MGLKLTTNVGPSKQDSWWLQNVPGITLFLRIAKHCNNWRYISIKILPLCNYILLPVTVKVLEEFLEAILWKPFQLFRRILNDVNSIKIAPSHQWCCRSSERATISWSQVMWDAPVLSHCSLPRNPWPKPTDRLEHCREGETNCWFPIFRGISFWPYP